MMQLVKRSYAGVMHKIADLAPMEKLAEEARHSDEYGWLRWSASLLAIHDIERMIALGLPWWNVAATREVAQFLRARPNARVFEYGAGASTIWLARHAARVTSVEHHAEWHQRLTKEVARYPNIELHHRELDGDAYIGAIEAADGPFDLIVVDGRRRTDCLARAIPHLAPGGIILFDDSGRARYRRAIATRGLKERRHFGRSYCVPYPDFTSILYG
jgi:hypothetical protein